MCGRYVLVLDKDGVTRLLREGDIPADSLKTLFEEGRVQVASSAEKEQYLFESYNIAPTHMAPVVVNSEGKRQLRLARWSFIPEWWSESKPPGFATFNARDDKLKTSRFWQKSVDKQRCMVPANGFYEWEHRGKERLPRYIHRKDSGLLVFAGIYSRRVDPQTRTEQYSFSIITTPTNRFMQSLHDRIPLTLGGIDDEIWSLWLDPMTSFEQVEHLVSPHEWPEMTMHAVSVDVNPTGRSRYVNTPGLIEPVEEQGEMF